jgi:hypothetical protein
MKYVRNKDIVARTVAGENLLVPINECTKKVFTLNHVGIRLWEEIEMPRTENELAEALTDRYGIARETALNDVQTFLKEMVRLKLALAE